MSGPADATEALSFDALGGVNTLLWVRAQGTAIAQIILAPALGLRASYYRGVADTLAGAGLDVAIVEWPGHGSSPVRAGRSHNWGYGELRAHLARARTALPRQSRVVWLGHSIGGQVAMMDAGEHPAEVAGVVLVASGTPWRGAWDGRARAMITLATRVFPMVGAAVGHHPGERLGFGGREARNLMREWAHLARAGNYPVDAEAALARMQGRILAVRIEGDDWAPERAVEHGLSKTNAAHIERHVWRGLPANNVHNRWPRLASMPVERIVEFVSAL